MLFFTSQPTTYYSSIFDAVAQTVGELWTQLNNFFTAYVIPFFEQIASFLSTAFYYLVHPLQAMKDFTLYFATNVITGIQERFLSLFPDIDFTPLSNYLSELFNNELFDNSVMKASSVIIGMFVDGFSGDGEWLYILFGLGFSTFLLSLVLRAIIEIFG